MRGKCANAITACLDSVHVAANFRHQCAHRRPAIAQRLAEHQIIRLNGGCAFIDRQDTGITLMLRRAGFLNEAHAAMYLHRIRCQL